MRNPRPRRWAAACVASLPLVLTLTSSAAAATPRQDAGAGSATVGVSADGWYAARPACTATPAGCLPVGQPPASPFPTKTLQVGVVGGQEESRTYLLLDLTAIPAGTTINSGTMRLPIGSVGDGSRAPETATLQACAVKGTFKDEVEGSTDKAPDVDCKAATSPAKYVAAAGSAPAAFTVDLGPFASAWSEGGVNSRGIALLPATDTAPSSAWQVALSAHDRTVAAPMRISATVTYSAATGDFAAPTSLPPASTTTSLGSGSASFAAPPLAPVASAQLPPVVNTPAAPAVAPQAAPVAPVQQFSPVASIGGFAYPGVFLLPILLAVVAGWLARALTRDLAPPLVA